jgi:hypothetical protein
MTKVYKIEKLNLPENLAKGFERFVVENKINEIIDWLNEHDESGRHVVPREKKEEIKWTKCDCMYYYGIEKKCALHLKLQKEEKIREPEGKQVSYPRDEKREKMAQDANYKNMPEYGEFWRNVKRSSIEEPKSGTHVGILLGDDEGVEKVTYDGKEIYSEEPKSTLKEVKVDKDTFDNVPNYKIHLPDCACGNHTKSTLKEEVRIIIHDDIRLTTHEQADKIISLFKDTLLKEVENLAQETVLDDLKREFPVLYKQDIINLIA